MLCKIRTEKTHQQVVEITKQAMASTTLL